LIHGYFGLAKLPKPRGSRRNAPAPISGSCSNDVAEPATVAFADPAPGSDADALFLPSPIWKTALRLGRPIKLVDF
jgi:hypothetical protein